MQREQYRRREQSQGGQRGYRAQDTGRLDYQQSGSGRREPDFRNPLHNNYSDRDYLQSEGSQGNYSNTDSDPAYRRNSSSDRQGFGNWDNRDESNRNDFTSPEYDYQRFGMGNDSDRSDRYRIAPSDFTGRSQRGSWDQTTSSSNAGYRQQGGWSGGMQEDWQPRHESSNFHTSGGHSNYDAGVDSIWSGGGRSFQESASRNDTPTGDSYRGKGPKGYQRTDERIQEDVCERLTQHPKLDASNLEVKVSQGEVTLSGAANGRYAKRLAEDIAEAVSGVREVTNQIRVSQNLDQPGHNGQTARPEKESTSATSGTRKGESETATSGKGQ